MKDGMKNGYSKIDVRCKHLSSMIMVDVESDEHLRIFKCLIDTGSHVLRNAIGIKVLNNNSISFIQYLENNKHQFYHQFEKKIWRKCCLGSPHGCVFPGTMDKKIFNKMYNKTAEHNTQDCLDRFETHAGISLDVLDLSDLNFFLWNSSSLSAQEEHSLKTIMSIRSAICHPSSSHSYSIDELEIYWSDLKSAVVLFAEPKCYKDIVEMQVETLQNCKLNVIESAKVIEKMKIESNKILHAIKQATPLKIVDIEKLIKDGTCGLENCVKSENNKTKSYINDTFQELKENIEKHHEVLSTRCREEIQTTVTQESSNIRLHSEDQSRAIDTKLTESEQRVCHTMIQSQGRLEDKLIEEQNKTRNHTVELKADLIEENRILKDEVMDVKTELKELKTILIGYIGKQKVDLVMNTDQIEKSTESSDKRNVDFTAKVNQTHVTADKENEIIENLPPEVEIRTNNDSSPEAALTEKIEITGKKTNSIILELKATPGILHSVDTFKAAILRLVQVMQTAGGIDVDIEETVTVNLRFESPLTENQCAVVKCLFAKDWNDDNNTRQLSTEYSSTEDVREIEFLPELDTNLQKGLQEENRNSRGIALGDDATLLCEGCQKRNKTIRDIERRNNMLQEKIWKWDQIDEFVEDANLRMNPLYKSSEYLEDAVDSAYKTGGTSDLDVFSDVHEGVSEYSGEQKERESYFRFSLVTTEIINYAYQKLIEMELKRKSISLEEFINLNQHRIQHMSINKSCCQCTSKAVIRETNICAIVLQTAEMKVLFDDQKKRRPGHSEQEHNTYCCCYAKSGIQLSSLTTKIANILLNFCTHDQEIIIVVKQLQEVVDEFNYTTSSANLTDVEYQYNYSSIALDALKKIGMYCQKEDEINLKLQDVQRFILYRKKLETLRLEKDIEFQVKDTKTEGKDMAFTGESTNQTNFNVCLWHSTGLKDILMVRDIVVPRMEQLNVKICPLEIIEARQLSTTPDTVLLNMTEKILVFISKNSLNSTWCSLERMTYAEQFQRINSCAIVLLLHDLLESEIPHLPVFEDAAIVHFSNDKDEWSNKLIKALTGDRSRIMKARNIAHGLASSHFYYFQQYCLPTLEERLRQSNWYQTQSEEIRSKVSFKLYEVIPKSCHLIDFSNVDTNIHSITTIPISLFIRAGNERYLNLTVYGITDGQETFYCICETPSVISVIKTIEDYHLARFTHIYEGNEEHSEASLKVDDYTLQLNRFCYAMKSIVNGFQDCIDTARVMLFDDEKERLSNVLFEALKEDLQNIKPKMKPEKIGTRITEQQCEYEVYVASVEHEEDRAKKNQILNYLQENLINNVLDDESIVPGMSMPQKLLLASQKCRWLIFILTRNFMTDESLTLSCLSKLNDIICRKNVRVIIVRENDARAIPECLRWLTYVPFDEKNQLHLKGLYSIISGNDFQMETQMLLSYGDIAYGLAWSYITNYLMKIIPVFVDGIDPAFREKGVNNYICPRKLYIVLPKSCNVVGDLTDEDRITYFSSTSFIYPFGNHRPFNLRIYRLTSTTASVVKNFFFVGQFAAPLNHFQVMKDRNVHQVNSEWMEIETEMLYKILCDLMKNALPDKAMLCEFVYFDDLKMSLADIMEQKINTDFT